MLEIEGLTKRFGGFTAVREVTFGLAEGEILGLIGPNGSGKSTIFNLISGALRPNGGSIRFGGREIGGLVPAKVCHLGIARTFQIPRPFRKLSIFDNVIVAAHYGHAGDISRSEAHRVAEDALASVNLPTEQGVPVAADHHGAHDEDAPLGLLPGFVEIGIQALGHRRPM